MTAANFERPEVLTPTGQHTLRLLMRAWFEFERNVSSVPILRRLDSGTFTLADYQGLLLNLRQQVVEGARWITRSASSFDRDYADIRSVVIQHAADEHRDYEMLEADYVASGGSIESIHARARNDGSEILHSYLMYRASQPNPVDMLGAMWIIEGLGEKMANDWAVRIEELLGSKCTTRFLKHHGKKDEEHMNRFYAMLDRACSSEATAAGIVRTARIVGRLYAMQLEDIDGDF